MPDDLELDECQYNISYENREYIAKFKRISLKEMAEHSDMIDADGYDGYLIAVHFFDETALKIALKELDDQSLAVGMIYLDNYHQRHNKRNAAPKQCQQIPLKRPASQPFDNI